MNKPCIHTSAWPLIAHTERHLGNDSGPGSARHAVAELEDEQHIQAQADEGTHEGCEQGGARVPQPSEGPLDPRLAASGQRSCTAARGCGPDGSLTSSHVGPLTAAARYRVG